MDKELVELEKELAAIRAKVNQIIGQRDSILKRMQTEYGVASIEEAKVKITELEAMEIEGKASWEKLRQEYISLRESANA